jgi:transcriptional regulator with AAA-type ATPase domain
MNLFTDDERQFAEPLAQLSYCNPFLPQRIELERAALGDEFDESDAVWSKHDDWERNRSNLATLFSRAERIAQVVHDRLISASAFDDVEVKLYEDMVIYVLYYRYHDELAELIADSSSAEGERRTVRFWKKFLTDYQRLLTIPGRPTPAESEAAHMFAGFFQVRRAFRHIFDHIVGSSLPTARVRAAAWQSIFTHDVRRYRRSLYNRLGDFTTLIMGPSGTGKELVARAIGLSRYIAFDPQKQRFAAQFAQLFYPLNISALSANLIESELFGHCRGAFTGALSDRAGWLELCEPLGTVFLDEIGDLATPIQVKLLRVLQTRTFQRSGETKDRQFHGKIIAATNQDLASKIADGTFREDFYYRLCSDIVTTAPLREQLADSPDDLGQLVLFITRRIVGDDASELAAEVEDWIDEHLGRDYAWPGNVRELEQCIRNVIIRRDYQPRLPAAAMGDNDPRQQIAADVVAGSLTADELLTRYCTLIYAQTGSYEQSAEHLNLDRRTVKSKIDEGLLKRLRDQR